MRKSILLLLLVLGLGALQADEYEYLWLHSPITSSTRSYAIDDLRKITFGNEGFQVYLKKQSSPITWAYDNLQKMTFEANPTATEVKNLVTSSNLMITHSQSAVLVKSPIPLKSVAIYNLQGNLLAFFGQGETNVSYSLSALPTGVYVVLAENADHSQTIKFVKH